MTTPEISPRASYGLTRRIPGGYYRMGSRFHPREDPPHTVYVAEVEMAHIPVTVSQYKVFLDSRPEKQKNWWSEAGWAWLQGQADGWGRENRLLPDAWEIQLNRPIHPVVGITAFEAEAYCAWLSVQRKKAIRLPTEEEWEFAARSDDGRPFPWGEEFEPGLANTLEGEKNDTVEAASTPGDASPFGLMDMAGNVEQWTASGYTPLAGEACPSGTMRVARGGSFNDTAYGARTSCRHAYPPGYFYPFLGFRLVVGER